MDLISSSRRFSATLGKKGELCMNAPAHESSANDRTVVSKNEARQGVTGHNVRYVLGFGLAAVAIAFVAIYVAYFGL
jgi:hypothetical protein